MPPAPAALVSAMDIATFQAWVAAGLPAGSCSNNDGGTPDAGPDPFDVPPTCTSMTKWTKKNVGSSQMHPGGACITCHSTSIEAPLLAVAGTVYATAHEPDDCNAATAMGPAVNTAKIVITDKNGAVVTIPINSVGNFYKKASVLSLALPFTAKVTYDGRERVMMTPQMSGDCNSCHTQEGTKNAPGRILLP
jgi:hypothetical protein